MSEANQGDAKREKSKEEEKIDPATGDAVASSQTASVDEAKSIESHSSSTPDTKSQSEQQSLDIREAPVVNYPLLLMDMTLPKEYLDILSPVLISLNCTISNDKAQEEIDGDLHQFTLVTRGQEYRVLMNVHEDIIAHPYRVIRIYLKDVLDVIAKKQKLRDVIAKKQKSRKPVMFFIFSEKSNAIIKELLKNYGREKGIPSEIIPFQDIRDVMEGTEKYRIRIITEYFKFEDEPEEGMSVKEEIAEKPHITKIQHDEKLKLRDIVSGIGKLQDDFKARRVMIETAQLDKVVDTFSYADDLEAVAWDLIDIFIDYGVVEKIEEHAMQRFLQHVIDETGDLPRTDKDFIEGILDKYDFGPNP